MTVTWSGLAAHAGKEVGARFTALEDDSSYLYSREGATIGTDGTVRLKVNVPANLNHEGPCKTAAPCDLLPVGLGPYRLLLTAGSDTAVVATGELTVVPARFGTAYPATLVNECGPPRVDFDGAVWVRVIPRPSQQNDPLSVEGAITRHDPAHATFTTSRTGVTQLKPADAATMATVGC